MSKLKVLAGDFLHGEGEYHCGILTIQTLIHPWPGRKIPVDHIANLRVAGSEHNISAGESIQMGIIGGLIAGPIGAITGIMLADKREEITFWIELKSGKTMLALSDEETFSDMQNRVDHQLRHFESVR